MPGQLWLWKPVMIGGLEAHVQSWAASVPEPALLDAAALIPLVLGVLLGTLVTTSLSSGLGQPEAEGAGFSPGWLSSSSGQLASLWQRIHVSLC